MRGNTSFRVNTPTVSQETIDGEAVIINLETGNYYSLTDAGSAIWGLMLGGHNLDAICSAICEAFEGEQSEIENGVRELFSELEQENLIVATDSVQSDPGARLTANAVRPQFQRPALQKFTDMQELLLLDPVHDVDDVGWPRKPE